MGWLWQWQLVLSSGTPHSSVSHEPTVPDPFLLLHFFPLAIRDDVSEFKTSSHAHTLFCRISFALTHTHARALAHTQ